EFQDTDDEVLALITQRRTADLAEFPNPPWFDNLQTWLDTQKEDGTWEDVIYLSGCDARRANWPIQEHWNRLITFASAWSGLNPAAPSNWTQDDRLLSAVLTGMDYWFENDYTESDCMGQGGEDEYNCPCGTPGLWNQNWYCQAILIPQLVSHTCLLVKDADLSEEQLAGCERIPGRAYDLRDGDYGHGGDLTGSNAVNVMLNSVSLALFVNNLTILEDAYTRVMTLMNFADEEMEDGIHRDGSFLQHDGILYNSNYGKDFLNAFIQLERQALDTEFEAGDTTKQAIAAQVRGNEWMTFIDEETRQQYWDFNAVGRFVSHPTSDLQANSDINYNLTKLAAATANFEGDNDVSDSLRRLMSNGTEKLHGNKGYWASDFMVHRQDEFVVTNKMLSTRSATSEYVNTANPYAYHFGQGTLFCYVLGNEYKDIMGAWDWNLVPGTTVLLNHPELQSSIVKFNGKKDFVGSVSDGTVGLSVEDYVDPYDGAISYRKAWFFAGDSVVVITTDIQVNSSATTADAITVLDNRASADGDIVVDGKTVDASTETSIEGHSLIYGGNGYLAYQTPFNLTLFEGNRTGNWSAISTSLEGETTVSIFSAYTTLPKDSFSYAFFPAADNKRLDQEMKSPTSTPIVQDNITAVLSSHGLGLVFWPGSEGANFTIKFAELGWGKTGSMTISSAQPGAYLLRGYNDSAKGGVRLVATLSDPTQKATSAGFSLVLQGAKVENPYGYNDTGIIVSNNTFNLEVPLPTGGMAGSSTSYEVFLRPSVDHHHHHH
uniref:Mannuronic acid specific lyase n=1 Tax=Paradendryphiella salina TaxID=179392 RepID=UPI0023580383|nr:Chain A, Mannuronic acid specific lyase [Paradendryphiella salina]7R2X_B Chain B, Mannuronic acid specific lyase [Paradendryphiella salina]